MLKWLTCRWSSLGRTTYVGIWAKAPQCALVEITAFGLERIFQPMRALQFIAGHMVYNSAYPMAESHPYLFTINCVWFIWQKKTSCHCTLYETNFWNIKTFPRVETSIYCWSFQKLECWCNCICGFFFIRMAIKQPKNRDKVIVKRDLFTYENYFLDFYWGSFFMRLALT